MRASLEKAIGAVGWLGLRRGGVGLGDRTVVVSPHLDDGVFSLGAAMAAAARGGARVTLLTVLAGDPASTAPAGPWDAGSGFATAGEAAAARRLEDERACRALGVSPAWLPFGDHQYERGDEEAVLPAILEAVAGAGRVLVPGFPLMHPDHAWLARALGGADFGPARLGHYVEQPYAALWHEGLPAGVWTPLPAALRDRLAKVRAWRAYGSQLKQIGPEALRRVVRYEAGRGGEAVAWIDG